MSSVPFPKVGPLGQRRITVRLIRFREQPKSLQTEAEARTVASPLANLRR
jgi:hypothetical protein